MNVMRNPVTASVMLGAAALGLVSDSAFAQPNVLAPMNVDTYRVMQRVSRNGGWGATAYRNYLIGLFEGLLNSQSSAAGDRHGHLFCLPPAKSRGADTETFEWLEKELNNVVARARPSDLVAQIFLMHLNKSYPCQG